MQATQLLCITFTPIKKNNVVVLHILVLVSQIIFIFCFNIFQAWLVVKTGGKLFNYVLFPQQIVYIFDDIED